MNKFFTVFCFAICLISNITAQNGKYIPIPSNMIVYGREATVTDQTIFTDYRMEIGGDTVVNGIHYSKYYNWKSIAGGIRNDILNKKVYLYSIQTGKEKLLYDFGLAVGDTIFKNEGYGFYTPLIPTPRAIFTQIHKAWISRIDSIKTPHDGLYHKQFHFKAIVLDHSSGNEVIVNSDSSGPYVANTNYKFYFGFNNLIEGVGFLYGTIGGASAFEYQWGLQPYCISIDKKSIFEVIGPPYDKALCSSIITGIDEENNQEDVSLYPNPSNGRFQLEVDTIKDKFFEIRDILGQKILKSKIREQITEIDLTAQPKGIYFIRIDDTAGHSETKKLIIH